MKKLFLILIGFWLSFGIFMNAQCAQRYRLQETIKPFSNYTMGNKDANGVFRILDTQTGAILYLKRTNRQEVLTTQKAGQIDFGNDPILHTVKIANLTNQEIEDMVRQIGLIVPKYVLPDTWLVTEKIPDGDTLNFIIMNDGLLSDGTQIQPTEIDDLITEIKIMRDSGINHSDLLRNTFVYRDESDKLRAYILDFEDAGTRDTYFIENELNELKKSLKISK